MFPSLLGTATLLQQGPKAQEYDGINTVWGADTTPVAYFPSLGNFYALFSEGSQEDYLPDRIHIPLFRGQASAADGPGTIWRSAGLRQKACTMAPPKAAQSTCSIFPGSFPNKLTC